MSDNEKPVNIHWLVGVPGRDDPLVVWAAYIYQPTVQGSGDPVVLKDANHKVVFQGHAQYVVRYQAGIKQDADGRWSPPADEAQPYSQITMPTSVAAGAPQTVYFPPGVRSVNA